VEITKEELANIIKEEVEKTLEEKMSSKDYEEWASENGMELKIVLDKEDNMISVPVSKPKLPKNWGSLPGRGKHPIRYWFRMWKKHGKKPAQGAAPRQPKPSSEKDASKALGQKPKKKSTPDDAAAKAEPVAKPKAEPVAKPKAEPKKIKPKRQRGRRGRLKFPEFPKLKSRPRLLDKYGKRKRTSMRMGDQWGFYDDTKVPVHNYIRGKGMVSDEEGIAYYNRRTRGKYSPDAMKEIFNVTKEELANIIKEEIEKALGEQVADFPSFAEWWQGDNRKKYPSPSRAKRGYSIARSKAVSQTQKNIQKAADDLKDEK
jgi:hypothetical protein